MAGLRQDRILHEAVEAADPLRLMRLFGIKEATAMHYVTVAHHQRMAGLSRWPARRSVGGGGRGRGSGGIADAQA
ncbi:Histidine kinase, DNA gyrase B, and HSP90-like ATPase [Streptomyces sp. CBMAI 2042]|nr:Histidine kinase, DNA gyrase B, and HSP90-like ATPase [Streptomyces sp. CBMAI 2042]